MSNASVVIFVALLRLLLKVEKTSLFTTCGLRQLAMEDKTTNLTKNGNYQTD